MKKIIVLILLVLSLSGCNALMVEWTKNGANIKGWSNGLEANVKYDSNGNIKEQSIKRQPTKGLLSGLFNFRIW